MMLVNYTDRAVKDLSLLDKQVAKRIVRKVEQYSTSEDPLSYAKQLTGNLAGRFRFRVGDYRVIFSKDSKGVVTILTILTIKHRKGVYR